jgi:hypothetical protein
VSPKTAPFDDGLHLLAHGRLVKQKIVFSLRASEYGFSELGLERRNLVLLRMTGWDVSKTQSNYEGR